MRASVLLLGFVGLFSACERDLPEVTHDEGERVAEIAQPAADELLRTLVGRLTEALEEGGPLQAMNLCSTEAIPLTRSVESGMEGALTLKRTSFRYRNPENAPDRGEEAALRFFEETLLAGEAAPPSYIQRVSPEEIRYYRPLFVGEVCLGCHGNAETMDPQVVRLLLERYPEDLATGYSAGAFRGVVRVSVPAVTVAGEGA